MVRKPRFDSSVGYNGDIARTLKPIIMNKNELKAVISYAKRFGYMKVPFTLVYELWASNYNPEQPSGVI